jgi:anti-sigma-K factor RskA
MTVSTQDIPEELHVLAGEYVLGALDAGEMRAVRRQAMVDPTLAAAIVGWEQRLAPLARAVPAMPPPDALWARIEETIAPMPDEFVEDEPAPAAAPRVRLATLLP